MQVTKDLEVLDEATGVLSRIDDFTSLEVRQACCNIWRSTMERSWILSYMIVKVREGRYFEEWSDAEGNPYRSVAAWANCELGGMSKSVVSKFSKVGAFMLTLPPEERERWHSDVSPYRAYDVIDLAKTDIDDAYELASNPGRTDGQVRQQAKEKDPGSLEDKSGFTTLEIQITHEEMKEVRQALNAVKHQMQQRTPLEGKAIALMAVEYLNGFFPDPLAFAYRPEYQELLREDIINGRLTCIDCGAWYPIQRHHAIPRSRGIEGKDPDSLDWPCVWICEGCHRKVTENEDGTWLDKLEVWMEKHPWLKTKTLEWLGDRDLRSL